MANRDEFDVIEPEEESEPRGPRYFLWIATILVVAFVAFAGGMAYFTLNRRLPPPSPTPTIPRTPLGVIAEVVATVADALATPTATVNAPTQTPAQQSVATPLPTATQLPPPATPVPATPTCAAADGAFALLANPAELGCPQGSSALVWSAIETFERGVMYWRSDTNSAYILYGTGSDGSWEAAPQRWDGQELPSRGTPPAGLLAPQRGFGYVWSTNDNVFAKLGWARQEELGFCALLQSFERGFIIISSSANSCTADGLYNRANDPGWVHFALMVRNDGIWRAFDPPAPQPTSAQPTPAIQPTATVAVPPTATATVAPTQSSTQRPAAQGIFVAQRLQPVALDARFDDWPNQWTQLSSIVSGGENFTGLNDIGAKFQTAWSVDGLYLAVQVQDDLYRAGPDGTEMWKGDGLELQFDRNLSGDFADTKANVDDFQLGISVGPDLNQIRVYRWLPFSLEAAFTGQGSVVRTESGYNLEMMLPWTYFEMNGSALQSNQLYGFNLSVNDNDSDAPAQETVLSASPARTTHDNPTEWGTLVIQ